LCFREKQLVASGAGVARLASATALNTNTVAGARAQRSSTRADQGNGAGGTGPSGQAVAFAGHTTTFVGIATLRARVTLFTLVAVSTGHAEALVVNALTTTVAVVVVAETDSLTAVEAILTSNAEAFSVVAKTLVAALVGASVVENLNFTSLATPTGIALTVPVVAQTATTAVVLALGDSFTVGTLEADLAEAVAVRALTAS